MKFKGTKGEWYIEKQRDDHYNQNIFAINTEGKYEFITVWYTIEDDGIQQHANALLISKAPEILKMLEYFTAYPDEDFESEFNSNQVFEMTVLCSKIKEAKQLIKEATTLK